MRLRNVLIGTVIAAAVVGAIWSGGDKGRETAEPSKAVKPPPLATEQGREPQSSPPREFSGVEVPEQGDRAPNFRLKTLNGKTVELAANGGKPSFINFWASWCGPCRAEMPDIQEAYEKYGDRVNFLMVNLTTTDDIDRMKGYIASKGFTFPILLDEEGAVSSQYGVNAIPTTYVVDAERVIVHKQLGPMSKDQIVRLLERLTK